MSEEQNLQAQPAALRAAITVVRKATGAVEYYNIVGYPDREMDIVRDRLRWVDPATGLEVEKPKD